MQNAVRTYDSAHIARGFGRYLENLESAKKICRNDQTSAAACCEVPTDVVPYENPAPIGWSMYIIFELLFHEYGFRVTLELSLVILHGPFAWSNPSMLEAPGWYSLNHQFLFSQLQYWIRAYTSIKPKSDWCSRRFITCGEEPKPVMIQRDRRLQGSPRYRGSPHTLRSGQISIARGLINAWCSFCTIKPLSV